jgi:hypothetical protein
MMPRSPEAAALDPRLRRYGMQRGSRLGWEYSWSSRAGSHSIVGAALLTPLRAEGEP